MRCLLRSLLIGIVAYTNRDSLPIAQCGFALLSTCHLSGSVAVAGLGISWLRDNLGLISSAAESELLAGSVPDTGEGDGHELLETPKNCLVGFCQLATVIMVALLLPCTACPSSMVVSNTTSINRHVHLSTTCQ